MSKVSELLSLNCEYILADDFSYQLMSLGVVVSVCTGIRCVSHCPQFIFIYLSIFPLRNFNK